MATITPPRPPPLKTSLSGAGVNNHDSKPPSSSKSPATKGPPKKKAPPPPPTGAHLKPSIESKKAAPSIIGRKLHWDAIQGKGIEGTIFQELGAEAIMAEDVAGFMDLESMKRIFAGQKPDRGIARRSTVIGELDIKRKIIGSSRAQNVAIVLSRLGQPVEEIATKINVMDPTGLGREILERVIDTAPTPDEMKEYDIFVKDKEEFDSLRDIEQKYWPFFKVERMKEKCRILLSTIKIPEQIVELKKFLDLIYEGGREVRKSQKFRALLVAVLLWGNFVNHGVVEEQPNPEPKEDKLGRRRRRAGTAGLEIRTFGFTLPSLLKLAEFKTTVDSSITSLHFIVANMIQSQPHVQLHLMCDEMLSVPPASKISAAALKEILANIQEEISFFKRELNLKDVNEVYGDQIEKIRQLYENAKIQYDEIKEKYDSITEFVGETAAYFGDATAKTRPEAHEEFFKTLSLFLARFQSCVNDYLKNTKKFQNILVESAQNRGLTYVEAGAIPESSIPTIGVPKAPPPKAKFGKAAISKAAANEPVAKDSITNDSIGFLARASQRRASMGASRQNIVISAKVVTEARHFTKSPPLSTAISPRTEVHHKPPAPGGPAAKRSLMRRSTAIGAYKGGSSPLSPMEEKAGLSTSKAIAMTKADIANRSQRDKQDSRTRRKMLGNGLQLEAPAVDSNYNSDTEVDLRGTRKYIVHDSPQEVNSDCEEQEGQFHKKVSTYHEKTKHEDNSAYRNIGLIIKDLGENEIERESCITPRGLDDALDMALEEYVKRGSSALDEYFNEYIR